MHYLNFLAHSPNIKRIGFVIWVSNVAQRSQQTMKIQLIRLTTSCLRLPRLVSYKRRSIFERTMSSVENKVLSMSQAEENLLDIGKGMKLWYRTWGNITKGIPVLFVHGGPGNSVDDYEGINEKFFDKDKFYVVEVDQRGTGKSQPSVRDDYKNMKLYMDISISQMANDFEQIRENLGNIYL